MASTTYLFDYHYEYLEKLIYSDKESIFYKQNKNFIEKYSIKDFFSLLLQNNYEVFFIEDGNQVFGSLAFEIKNNEIFCFSIYFEKSLTGRKEIYLALIDNLLRFSKRNNIRKISIGLIDESRTLTKENRLVLGYIMNYFESFFLKYDLEIEKNIVKFK